MYFATGEDPTKEMARTLGCVSRASTRGAAAVDDVEDALGQARLGRAARRAGPRPARHLLAGHLRMKVLPAAIAIGYIQSGTITREVEGRRSRRRRRAAGGGSRSLDAAGQVLERIAEEERGDPAGVLADVLQAAVDAAAARLRMGLPVLARDHAAELGEVALDQLAIADDDARALHGRGLALQAGKRPRRRPRTAASTSAGPPAGHSAITSPVEGLKTGVPGIFGWSHSPLMSRGAGVSSNT